MPSTTTASKRYVLPKYLENRKIELVRIKIIKRKYGYMFYRKAICKRLPSQANKYYISRIKKKCFLKLKVNWHQERLDWKLTLRATLHYNYILKSRVFSEWGKYMLEQKAEKIKTTISVILYKRNDTKVSLRYFFTKWLMYLKYRQEKHGKYEVADQHYKSKYKPEHCRVYFARWKIYTIFSRKAKLKIESAKTFYNSKLMLKIIKKLKQYLGHRKWKLAKLETATTFHEKKLKMFVINHLQIYCQYRRNKQHCKQRVQRHFEKKLMLWTFTKLLNNKKRGQFIRHTLRLFNERQRQVLLARYLNKLQKYKEKRKLKKYKQKKASDFYDIKLKKQCIYKLRKYVRYCELKQQNREEVIRIVQHYLNRAFLRPYLQIWINYMYYKQSKKAINLHLTMKYEFKLKKYCFTHLLEYKQYRQNKAIQKHIANNHYRNQIKRKYFLDWLNNIKEQKNFYLKIEEAKSIYQENLMRGFLVAIFKASEKKTQHYMKAYVNKAKLEIELAQKYFSIWKYKTIYKKEKSMDLIHKRNNHQAKLRILTVEENKENVAGVSTVFSWNPACFLQPRIPYYMQKSSLQTLKSSNSTLE